MWPRHRGFRALHSLPVIHFYEAPEATQNWFQESPRAQAVSGIYNIHHIELNLEII